MRVPRRSWTTRRLTLRWRTTDRDRGDRLLVAILAHRGRGKFRTFPLGPAKGGMALDPRTLGNGKRLTLRLLISDGLTATVGNAKPVRLSGRR